MLEPKLVEKATNENLVKLEHLILKFWEDIDLHHMLINKNKGRPKFSFLDGPITANNPMGVHHAWGRTLKDVVQRFKSMKGFDQRYQNGFDTQGLWLEVEVEKSLNLNSKKELEEFGLDKFAEKCKQRVQLFSQIITDQSKRLGQSMDWDNSYYTHTDKNINSIWYFLKECYNRGWLYKGHKPMPWCTRCGTSLSQHEQLDSYEQVKHLAVYSKFFVPKLGCSLLVWTTTPWTLPANVAVAVNKDLEYGKFRHNNEVILAGLWLKDDLFKNYELVEVLKGEDLLDLSYENIFPNLEKNSDKEKPVVHWENVTNTEGTGFVHIAPGCGPEDYELSRKYNLNVISILDDDGYCEKGFGMFSFLHYSKVNDLVRLELQSNNLLFTYEDYDHRYPHCWRCKNELVYRLVDEWFIATDEIRPLLKKAANKVKWTPEHIGKLFQNWLDNMGDWCISRKRYWGLPLPFYPCECGHLNVLGSEMELYERSNYESSDLKELHKPWIDEVKIECEKCKKDVSRIKEVGDCWLDAGITPFSTLRYFENKEYWNEWFPADFVCEMREQTRLWFYSTMFMSVVLTGKPPYKKLVAYEKVYDKDGNPMHKSSGNAIWFDDAVENVGADALRLFYLNQNLSYIMKFNYKEPKILATNLLSLWNVALFFKNLADLDAFRFKKLEPESLLDHWLLSKLDNLRSKLEENFESFAFNNSIDELCKFSDDLSKWYVRRSRRRFWLKEYSQEKKAAFSTLYFVLNEIAKLIAPMTPFFSELLYSILSKYNKKSLTSVHLEKYPKNYDFRDDNLELNMTLVRELVSKVHYLRSKSQLKVKQPLSKLYVKYKSDEFTEFLDQFQSELKQELNIKQLKTNFDVYRFVNIELKLNYKRLGKLFGSNLKHFEADLKHYKKQLSKWYFSNEEFYYYKGYKLMHDDLFVKLKAKEHYALDISDGFHVVLDLRLDKNLRNEGFVREFVRYAQEARKKMELNLDDQINLQFWVDDDIRSILEEHKEFIWNEVQIVKWQFNTKLLKCMEFNTTCFKSKILLKEREVKFKVKPLKKILV